MKGFFIVLFALFLFAFAKLCCEEKKPNIDPPLQQTERY